MARANPAGQEGKAQKGSVHAPGGRIERQLQLNAASLRFGRADTDYDSGMVRFFINKTRQAICG